MISIRDVHKTYVSPERSVVALDGVSLEIANGEIFGVVGQSGAGKSTLIRTVNALERPTSGSVVVDGVDVTALTGAELRAARHSIGMIFQHFNLLSSRTTRGNVELPLEVAGVRKSKRRARALEILDLVGLADRADSYPAQLSGGQKQRVGIARALAAEPSVLLSDEATSALDPETTASILGLIKKVNRELGVTVLLITHEMEVVKRICDSAALMEHGRIVEQGTIADLIVTPGSRIARSLFPMGERTADSSTSTVVEITFAGQTSHEPVISRLVRGHGLDVSILGAAIETIRGEQVGRLRLEIPGDPGLVQTAVADLRGQGLFVETFGGEARA